MVGVSHRQLHLKVIATNRNHEHYLLALNSISFFAIVLYNVARIHLHKRACKLRVDLLINLTGQAHPGPSLAIHVPLCPFIRFMINIPCYYSDVTTEGLWYNMMLHLYHSALIIPGTAMQEKSLDLYSSIYLNLYSSIYLAT